MILVLFELEPAEGRSEAYFDFAAALKPELDTVDGFVSIERFESLAVPGRFLSLSVWRDEAAVRDWRNRPSHRAAQSAARDGVIDRYRLRVAAVIRDYGHDVRDQVPGDSLAAHDASDV